MFTPHKENKPKWIAGFWRRVGAVGVDVLFLTAIDLVLVVTLTKPLMALGPWRPLVSFLMFLIYFGVMNSQVCGGQTFGKKWLKIKVVDVDNQSIGVLKSFLRFAILGTPISLKLPPAYPGSSLEYWFYIVAHIFVVVIISIIYLYLFNRKTRQSLHDLAVGTYVVNVEVEKQEITPIWKPHFIVVALFFVGGGVNAVLTKQKLNTDFYKSLGSIQLEIIKMPVVNHVSVFDGHAWSAALDGSDKRVTRFVKVTAYLNKDSISDNDLARKIAEGVVSVYPQALERDAILIKLSLGYNVGFFSMSADRTHKFDPKELAIQK